MKLLLSSLVVLAFASVVLGQSQCHWNGRYTNNRCQCFAGFTGTNCDQDCHCAGHGTCKPDGTCQCEAGWKWSGADQKCVWDCSCDAGIQCIGPSECGCAHDCGKWGQCRNGVCQCYEGYKGDTCNILDTSIMMNKDVSVGINIGGISYYSSELKWVDVAKQSQEWITERQGNNAWDTHEQAAVQWRPDGYPVRLDADMRLVKLMYRGFGPHEERGNYTVLYDGEGILEFGLTHFNTHYDGKGRMVVEFDNINDGGILMKLVATNPQNPIRNIRMLPPGYENTYERFPFHPLFLEFLQRFSEIRFMDYLATNGHTPEPTTWASVKPKDFHTQEGSSGGAIEYLVELCNVLGANPWVNMPHAADDDYIKKFAQYVKDNLRPDLTVYVEYSNEVWNGIFRQTQYTKEQGRPLFPSDPDFKQGMKYFNKRTTEVTQLWDQVWGSAQNRLFHVYAWQTGFQDYFRQALEDLGARHTHFDAIAVTGYFDCDDAAGTKHASEFATMTMTQIQHLCDTDLHNSRSSYHHFMDVAASLGLKLVMYEGGPGVMENGVFTGGQNQQAITDQAIAFNQDPHIQKPVEDILEAWFDVVSSNSSNSRPGGLFNYFASVGAPSTYGSWGMAQWTGQDLSTIPKWMGVQSFITRHWASNPLGPKCSFVKDRTTGTAYGCFANGNHYVCAESSDSGHSWTNLPQLNAGKTLTLDGYNPTTRKLYVRATDSTDVVTYNVLDLHSRHWTTLQNWQYYSEEIAGSVIPRMPVGASGGLDAGHHC